MDEQNNVPIGGLTREELNDFEYVRSEFTTPVFKAKITFDYSHFALNAACVRLFPENEYVQILADRKKRRLLIWPCKQNDKDSVKWSNIKNEKPQSRSIRAKMLCAKVFKMMNWVIENRYKIMAVYQELDELKFIVFNLVESEMYVPGDDTISKTGKVKKTRNKVYPLDWEKTFGSPYAEHKATYQTDINTMRLLSDEIEPETSEPSVTPRVPTASEIITRNYYVPDSLTEEDKPK